MNKTKIKQQIEELSKQYPTYQSPEIAEMVGCHPAYVRSIWNSRSRPHGKRSLLKLYPSREYMAHLCTEADKLGVTPDELAMAFLNDAIAADMEGR